MVDERPLTLDLYDRQPLTVLRLELGIARDVDRDELEPELIAGVRKNVTRPVAEVTTGRVVERDGRARDTARALWWLRRPG